MMMMLSPTLGSYPKAVSAERPTRVGLPDSITQKTSQKVQDSVTFSGKIACKPTHYLRTPAYPDMLNDAGFVDAGHVLKLIDIAGSEPALAHVRKQNGLVVTASLDRTSFQQPIQLWEIIELESRLTRTWNTSMETRVKVTAENLHTGKKRDIATAHLVFVALDPATRQKLAIPQYDPQTWNERQLAHEADIRKKNRQEEGRVAPFVGIDAQNDDPIVVRQVMTPDDANAQANVFGGIILSTIDKAGLQAAQRQALSGTVVGVSQDRMSFIGPTFIGETVEAKAIVTKTWTTSMEVQVEVEAVNPVNNSRRKVASSYLVYVRLGANGKPAEVPPWLPQTDLQRQRAEAADVRRRIRQEEESQYRESRLSPNSSIVDRIKMWFKKRRG